MVDTPAVRVDAADDGEPGKLLQRRGPRQTDMYRQIVALLARRSLPVDERLGIEAELRDDPHAKIGVRRELRCGEAAPGGGGSWSRRARRAIDCRCAMVCSARGYFRPAAKKPKMVDNLRAVLTRPGFTEAEIKVLRGVVAYTGV